MEISHEALIQEANKVINLIERQADSFLKTVQVIASLSESDDDRVLRAAENLANHINKFAGFDPLYEDE